MVSMNKMENFARRLRYKLKHDYLTVENMVLLFAIALCLVWTVQSVVAMSRNWALSERLAEEKRTLAVKEMEVKMAELENEYYRTDEYQELLARKYMDKALPGENMVIMPDNSDGAKKAQQTEVAQEELKDYSNLEKWMMFLFPDF